MKEKQAYFERGIELTRDISGRILRFLLIDLILAGLILLAVDRRMAVPVLGAAGILMLCLKKGKERKIRGYSARCREYYGEFFDVDPGRLRFEYQVKDVIVSEDRRREDQWMKSVFLTEDTDAFLMQVEAGPRWKRMEDTGFDRDFLSTYGGKTFEPLRVDRGYYSFCKTTPTEFSTEETLSMKVDETSYLAIFDAGKGQLIIYEKYSCWLVFQPESQREKDNTEGTTGDRTWK